LGVDSVDEFQKNPTMGPNYGPSSAYPFQLLFFEEWCSRKKMSPRVSISFHLKTFRSKATEVISAYCSDVFCKLEYERLNGIFRSVLPEKRFIR